MEEHAQIYDVNVKKNNVSCTDFCGCDSICENIDVRPSDYVAQEMTENESITTDD